MQTEKAVQFALDKLKSELSASLVYHDTNHTLEVMEQSNAIAEVCGISKKEIELLKTAAAFHDIGYIYVYDGHEAKSCEMARIILPEFSFDEQEIERVCKLIMTTKMPQSPFDLESGILCDADLDYLGRNDYDEKADALRVELESIGLVYDEKEWLSIQFNFVKNHKYHSPEEQQRRNQGKKQNLDIIESRLRNA